MAGLVSTHVDVFQDHVPAVTVLLPFKHHLRQRTVVCVCDQEDGNTIM